MLFEIRHASAERKYLITASNLTELPLTVNKSSKNVLLSVLLFVLYSIIALFVYIFSPVVGAFLTLLIHLSFPILGNLIKKLYYLSNPHPLPAPPPPERGLH